MLFNSFDFLIFFVTVFAVQLTLPRRVRNLFLLSASYVFYGCWDWRFLGLMLLSTVIENTLAVVGTNHTQCQFEPQ